MLLTKKQLLNSANRHFPEYLNTVPGKELAVLKRKFVAWPKVLEVSVIYCLFEGGDVTFMQVYVRLKIDNEKKEFICHCGLVDSSTECVILPARREHTIFLKHFINYFFYQVLLEENEISANEWNNWDKIRRRTLEQFDRLK